IGILAAMLLPVLVGAKERTRRVNCKNSQRQFVLAVHLYGDDNEQRVPSGAPNPRMPPNDDHLPVISIATSNALVQYLLNRRLVHCPSFGDYFIQNQPEGPYWQQEYGYVIGYNYHGGHTNTPWPPLSGYTARWVSPKKLTENS